MLTNCFNYLTSSRTTYKYIVVYYKIDLGGTADILQLVPMLAVCEADAPMLSKNSGHSTPKDTRNFLKLLLIELEVSKPKPSP